MDKEKLKKELLYRINSCEDFKVLKKIWQLLEESTFEVSEAGKEYIKENDADPIPDWLYKKLGRILKSAREENLKLRVGNG